MKPVLYLAKKLFSLQADNIQKVLELLAKIKIKKIFTRKNPLRGYILGVLMH